MLKAKRERFHKSLCEDLLSRSGAITLDLNHQNIYGAASSLLLLLDANFKIGADLKKKTILKVLRDLFSLCGLVVKFLKIRTESGNKKKPVNLTNLE